MHFVAYQQKQKGTLCNLFIQRLDDIITASHRTSLKFTSCSYFLKLNTLSLNRGLKFIKNLWECESFLTED